MEEIDYYEIYVGYRNMAIYLTLMIIICALISFYLLHLYSAGDAHMFNMTNESWSALKNGTIGFPKRM